MVINTSVTSPWFLLHIQPMNTNLFPSFLIFFRKTSTSPIIACKTSLYRPDSCSLYYNTASNPTVHGVAFVVGGICLHCLVSRFQLGSRRLSGDSRRGSERSSHIDSSKVFLVMLERNTNISFSHLLRG